MTFLRTYIHHFTTLARFAVLLLSVIVCNSCENDTDSAPAASPVGRVVLSFERSELFVDVMRGKAMPRAALNNLSDYVFTLTGHTADGQDIEQILSLDASQSAVIAAGTYSLSMSNRGAATTGVGVPCYEGTAVTDEGQSTFTIEPGETVNLTFDLGLPKNAQVTIHFDTSFSTLYDGMVEYNGETLADGDSFYAMPGNVAYIIKATAKAGSHVSDLPHNGISGSLNVAAATAYPLNITANTIADMMIGIGEGTHTGTFDSKRR